MNVLYTNSSRGFRCSASVNKLSERVQNLDPDAVVIVEGPYKNETEARIFLHPIIKLGYVLIFGQRNYAKYGAIGGCVAILIKYSLSPKKVPNVGGSQYTQASATFTKNKTEHLLFGTYVRPNSSISSHRSVVMNVAKEVCKHPEHTIIHVGDLNLHCDPYFTFLSPHNAEEVYKKDKTVTFFQSRMLFRDVHALLNMKPVFVDWLDIGLSTSDEVAVKKVDIGTSTIHHEAYLMSVFASEKKVSIVI